MPTTHEDNNTDNQYSASGISIGDFMGASLVSIARAQSTMSKEQARAFVETCFIQRGDSYEPIMLQMVLTRAYLSENGELNQVQANFNLPLLTLLPVNILGVDTVDLKFNFEITSQFVGETQKKSKSELKGDTADTHTHKNVGFGASKNIQLLGGIGGAYNQEEEGESKSKTDTRSKSSIQVQIQAKPLPLSQGMLSLIDIYTKSITPTEQKK